MFNIRLAGDRLYGKWLFTWLSLVMSLMVSYFVLSFSNEMSCMSSGTELSQFPMIFLLTHPTDRGACLFVKNGLKSNTLKKHTEYLIACIKQTFSL